MTSQLSGKVSKPDSGPGVGGVNRAGVDRGRTKEGNANHSNRLKQSGSPRVSVFCAPCLARRQSPVLGGQRTHSTLTCTIQPVSFNLSKASKECMDSPRPTSTATLDDCDHLFIALDFTPHTSFPTPRRFSASSQPPNPTTAWPPLHPCEKPMVDWLAPSALTLRPAPWSSLASKSLTWWRSMDPRVGLIGLSGPCSPGRGACARWIFCF